MTRPPGTMFGNFESHVMVIDNRRPCFATVTDDERWGKVFAIRGCMSIMRQNDRTSTIACGAFIRPKLKAEYRATRGERKRSCFEIVSNWDGFVCKYFLTTYYVVRLLEF